MDRHHQIRVAVRGLKGEERARAILKLLINPSKILEVSLNRNDGKRTLWLGRKGRKVRNSNSSPVTLSIRITPEEYITLRNKAGGLGKMSAFVRAQLFEG